jgi:hypothetical protein
MTLFHSFTSFVIACCLTVKDHYSDIALSLLFLCCVLWGVRLFSGAVYVVYSGGVL